MSAARSASAYQRLVDRWVVVEIESGVSTFDDLLCSLPGVYPTHVAASIDRLRQADVITKSQRRRAMRRKENEGPHCSANSYLLPPPHPLDFDWRYSPDTIEQLVDRAVAATQPGETVALLGTPSLHVAQLTKEHGRRFVLIDANPLTVERVKTLDAHRTVYKRDLFANPVPALNAAAVIADPPWYDEHIEAFMWTASEVARPEAQVFVSLPAIGTRPGSRAERKAFRSTAERMAMRIEEMRLRDLAYVSPPFETNALAAAGWTGLPIDWRRGDLGILRTSGSKGPRPTRAARETRWEEHSLGWVRIRVRRDPPTRVVDPTLEELVPGAVLPDVSRRHRFREMANVWTSGNRVYCCQAPRLLLVILRAIASGSNPRAAVASTIGRTPTAEEDRAIAQSVSQLKWIARIEGRELAHHGWSPHRVRHKTAS
jgi:hypothetical protein